MADKNTPDRPTQVNIHIEPIVFPSGNFADYNDDYRRWKYLERMSRGYTPFIRKDEIPDRPDINDYPV